MQRKGSVYFALFLIILSLFIFISSFQIETADKPFLASPLVVPIILSAVMFIFSIFILLKEIKTHTNKERTILIDKPLLFIGYFFLVLAYVLLMMVIGFNIATFLFLGISIIYLRGTSIIKSVIISFVITLLVVSLFGMIFEIVFPSGSFKFR